MKVILRIDGWEKEEIVKMTMNGIIEYAMFPPLSKLAPMDGKKITANEPVVVKFYYTGEVVNGKYIYEAQP